MTDVAAAKPMKPAGPFSGWEIELALRYLRARRAQSDARALA